MYYIYFPFVLILSGFIFVECRKRQMPVWWAAVVFAAPVTAPYFIFKVKTNRPLVLFMIFLTAFTAVCGTEFHLYMKEKERSKYDHLPPVARQVMRFSDLLKNTTRRLDKALVELEQMSKVESRIAELKETIDFISELRTAMAENQAVIQRMVKFTSDYHTYFRKKGLNWVHQIQLFYTDRNVLRHNESLERYLHDFGALLEFTYKNFDGITKLQDPILLKNYDEYYLRYRRAVDAHNRFNVKRIEFQNTFLKKYPDVKPYLPGHRQTEIFRLWE